MTSTLLTETSTCSSDSLLAIDEDDDDDDDGDVGANDGNEDDGDGNDDDVVGGDDDGDLVVVEPAVQERVRSQDEFAAASDGVAADMVVDDDGTSLFARRATLGRRFTLLRVRVAAGMRVDS